MEPTKRMANQRDLALAYSPGVAAACEAIVADPEAARDMTARGNLVAVITNGTAVLGLGAIGALASKPVMEGKAALFKKFAGIDVFDLEIEERDPGRFVQAVAALVPTFGGINLEDIKAPECFAIERALRECLAIPVFHDDQHGTAIVCAAAVLNFLSLSGKSLAQVKLVTSGAGAAALACVDLLVSMGLPPRNVTLTDIEGVVYEGRGADMPPNMARYARRTDARSLGEVLPGADIFLGLSAPRVLNAEWLDLLAPHPLILALANPDPEILPEVVAARRPDAIIATGRSDYPNQVNNVLCFPFIFRGALDVGACEINEAMKVAAVQAIGELARTPASDVVVSAHGGTAPVFGPGYIIPKPFDPRLILHVAPAVAAAAMTSGVARRPIADFDAYRRDLERFVYRSGQLMRPVFVRAATQFRRVAYAEGEDDRVLRAAQSAVDERVARPVLLGRREAIEARICSLGLRLQVGVDIEIYDLGIDRDVFGPLFAQYRGLVARRGVPAESANRALASRPGVAAAMLLRTGAVDAALCGGVGDWWQQMLDVMPLIPRRADVSRLYALSAVIMRQGALFMCDTHLNLDPSAEQLAEMTVLATEKVRSFGVVPRAALLSHSSFGASSSPSARKMRQALALIREGSPDFQVEGEMHADAALLPHLRERLVADSALDGPANLLIMPNLDASQIAVTLLSAAEDALPLGPIIMGFSKPLHILATSVTARGILNMTALCAAQANCADEV